MRWFVVSALALAFAFLPACGGCNNDPAAVPCTTGTDNDGDFYGEGCESGPDCDDSDPNVHDDCCAEDPENEGCPCDSPGEVISCFDGPDSVSNNPPCMKGERTCEGGTWGGCVGQVAPDEEYCDGTDNDCDLETDEGVLTSCGNCIPGCDDNGVDTDPFPTDPPIETDGVGLDPNGDLVLDSSTYEDHYIWVANDAEGTVSKIDTKTGAEVARYASVTHDTTNGRVRNHVGRTYPAWDAGGGGLNGTGFADNRPSRTAIDFAGDAWVANRAHDFGGLQPSITKFRNDPDACPDVDGDGVVETSRDVNGTPGIQVDDPTEFFGEADECIWMTVVVGDLSGTARALAIDAGSGGSDPGNVWVGMWGEMAFYQIDGTTGDLIQRVATPNLRPYGAAIDSQGRLWAPDDCCGGNRELGRIDTTMNPAPYTSFTSQPTFSNGAQGSYGIVVDLEDRVWIGGWPYGGLTRYNPATNTWVSVEIPTLFGSWGVRGVGIDSVGRVWAAIHQNWADGQVARFDADTATFIDSFQIDGPQGTGDIPVGVGVDFDGNVWTVNQNSIFADNAVHRGNASRLYIDPGTGNPAPHPTTGNQVDTFLVGRQPYTYSDFTGLGLRTVTRPSGEYVVPIQGCMDGGAAHWLSVTWDATTPANTAVEIYVRSGNDLATLGTQTQYGPWTVSPADLQVAPGPVPDGRYLQLTIRLLSLDNESTPIVHGYNVQWTCPGPG